MREYFTLHRSVFPSYLTIESGRIYGYARKFHSSVPKGLVQSAVTCPFGYDIYWAHSHKCIKFVSLEPHAESFPKCGSLYVQPAYIACTRAEQSYGLKMETAVNSVCRNDSINATAFKETFHRYDCGIDVFDVLHAVFATRLLNFYPSQLTVIHMARAIRAKRKGFTPLTVHTVFSIKQLAIKVRLIL